MRQEVADKSSPTLKGPSVPAKNFAFRAENALPPVVSTTLPRAAPVFFWMLVVLAGGLGLRCIHIGPADFGRLDALLLAGAGAMAAAVFLHASLTFSIRAAVVLLAISLLFSFAAECSGVLWGVPFGARYVYNAEFTPKVAGLVPVFVCLAWFVLSYGPLVLLREFALAWRGARWSRLLAKALLLSVVLASADLYLDPLAVSLGAWRWEGGGIYFGVPLSNFLGWFATACAIYVPFLALGLDSTPGAATRSRLDPMLASAGLVFKAMALAAAVKATQSCVPAVLTLAAMAPYAKFWLSALRGAPGIPKARVRGELSKDYKKSATLSDV